MSKREAEDESSAVENTVKRSKQEEPVEEEDVQTMDIVQESKTSQCFYNVRARLYVNIAPIYIKDARKGVAKLHLDPLLMNYSPMLRGVVVSHSNMEFEQQEAKVMYDSPYSYVWISAEFLVWRPKEGQQVEGYINMQSPSHIGLLIHDTFNASIKKDLMPADWTFVPNQEDENAQDEDDSTNQPTQEDEALTENDPSSNSTSETAKSTSHAHAAISMGYWVDGQGKRVDGTIQFTIRRVFFSAKMVSVQGALIEPNSESRSFEREYQSNNADASSVADAKPKAKHITFD